MQKLKKLCALLIACTIVLGVSPITVFAEETAETIAGFNYTAVPSSGLPFAATEGDTTATLSTNATGTPAYSTKSIAMTGWENGGAGAKYWEINFDASLKAYSKITFNAQGRSSSSGPANWSMIYSVDGGVSWDDVPNSSFTYTSTSLSTMYSDLELPNEVLGESDVTLRISMVDETTIVTGKTIDSKSVSNINNIVIRGDYDDTVDPISDQMVEAAGAKTIAQVNAMTNDGSETAKVIGQVAYAYPSSVGYANNTFIIQDVIGGEVVGLQIYDSSHTYNVGDIITVTGTVSVYGGVTQITTVTDVTVIDNTTDAFKAQKVTVAELLASGDDYISEYIVIKDVTLGAYSSSTTTVTDISGSIDIYRGAAFPSGVAEGSVVDLYCCYSKYSTTYQLRVGSSSDYYTGTEEEEDPIIYSDPISDQMVSDAKANTISDAISTASGTMTVIGQVAYAYPSSVGGTVNTYIIQDVINNEVVGLQIYDGSHTYTVGDIITVTGAMGNYGGVPQVSTVTDVTVINSDTAKFKAQEVTISKLLSNNADYLSEYVVIKDVTLGAYDASSISISDGTGSINIYRGAAYPEGVEAGSVVDLYCCSSAYSGTYQLRVGSSSDYVTDSEIDTSITYGIANWAGTAAPTSATVYGDLYAANDYLDTNAIFTHSTGNIPVVNNNNLGYTGLAEGDYYQMQVDSSLLGNINFSYKMRGSATGARDFNILYSTDGVNFAQANSSVLQMTASGSYLDFSVDLPSDANNASTLYIRLQVASSINIDNGTIGNQGTNYLQEVKITGNPIISDDIVRIPAVEPAEGNVLLGQEITMTCETEGATIYYSFDGTNYSVYDSANKPALTSLPAELSFYAVKAGLTDSLKMTYDYTQAQVASVKASPNGGAVVKNSKVTLTCATEGSVIKYSRDGGNTWEDYDTLNKLQLTELPANILVMATADGYLNSAVTTLSYTERENEFYNIYFGQMHSHTDLSDGAGTINQAYERAAQAEQIDYLFVTDHSNWFDNNTAASLADGSMSTSWNTGQTAAAQYTTSDFIGLYGFEMTWANGLGHINTFNTPGFQSRTQADYATYSTALQNYYATLKTDTGSISQFNHPGTTFGDFSDFSHYDEEIDALITLIEVGNGEGAIGSSGYFPSYEYYTRALDKGWHVAPTNNQDNHKGNWGDSNTARSVVLADTLSEDNIYDAMRNMRVYATEDNDLEIYYTLDDNIMGTILDEDAVGENIELKVKLDDPTDSAIGQVQVIVNGGLVAASQYVDSSSDTVTFTMSPDYSYYYIKVIQADGDIAVTAPVWVGAVEACGISSVTTTTALPIAGESIDVNLELYNNEATDLDIEKIEFTVDGEVVHTADLASAGLETLASLSTATYTFDYTKDMPGSVNIYCNVYGTLNGVDKVYTGLLQVSFAYEGMVTKVVVDGTHYNDYVTGYYGGNMGNLAQIAADNYAQVNVVTDEITKEILDDCQLLIISAPAKKTDTANAGDFTPSAFEDEFIQLVADYVKGGGTVIISGLADYQDRATTEDGIEAQSSTQMNKLLAAIGATSRINSDQAWDDDNNGGQEYRLYLTNHNFSSVYTEGVTATQKYSQYSGCTVLMDKDAIAAGTVEYLVKGHDTTYSKDSNNYDNNYVEIEKGNANILVHEKVTNGDVTSNVFISGGVFMSDFEVSYTLDNASEEQYSNKTIIENILKSVAVKMKTSTIAEARKGEMGEVFAVEGYVTAGTANDSTTFFDTIYIQDETGGITIFPYAESGLELGTKVRIIGYVDAYQGDLELQIITSEILDDENLNVIQPEKMSAADAMNYDVNGGKLIQVEGTIADVENDVIWTSDTAVSQITVTDENGDKARVFIDGYIYSGTDGKDGQAALAELIKSLEDGASISAVGLLYMHPDSVTGDIVPVLRVRDLDEIVTKGSGTESPGVSSTESPGESSTESPGESSGSGSSSSGDSGNGASSNDSSSTTAAKTGDTGQFVMLICIAISAATIFVVRKRKQLK